MTINAKKNLATAIAIMGNINSNTSALVLKANAILAQTKEFFASSNTAWELDYGSLEDDIFIIWGYFKQSGSCLGIFIHKDKMSIKTSWQSLSGYVKDFNSIKELVQWMKEYNLPGYMMNISDTTTDSSIFGMAVRNLIVGHRCSIEEWPQGLYLKIGEDMYLPINKEENKPNVGVYLGNNWYSPASSMYYYVENDNLHPANIV